MRNLLYIVVSNLCIRHQRLLLRLVKFVSNSRRQSQAELGWPTGSSDSSFSVFGRDYRQLSTFWCCSPIGMIHISYNVVQHFSVIFYDPLWKLFCQQIPMLVKENSEAHSRLCLQGIAMMLQKWHEFQREIVLP